MNAYFDGLRKQSNAVHGLLRNQLKTHEMVKNIILQAKYITYFTKRKTYRNLS